jgi:hypothetical protein
MSIEVIGAGFGRTGTRSLKDALEMLGYDACYHMVEVFEHPEHLPVWERATRGERVDWSHVYEGYRAAVDWPCCAFWKDYYHLYPAAKVILSVRDADRWYDSVMKTIYPRSIGFLDSDEERLRSIGAWIKELVWEGTFDGKVEDREHAKAVYKAHNAQVQRLCDPSRLLVFEASQGWEPLCAFLSKPAPDEPYPRSNTSEQFIAQKNTDDAEMPT